MRRITKASFKNFIKRNRTSLFLKRGDENQFSPASIEPREHLQETTLGIDGIWLTYGSKNYFEEYEDSDFIGIEVSNICGKAVAAVKKSP